METSGGDRTVAPWVFQGRGKAGSIPDFGFGPEQMKGSPRCPV